MPNWAADAALAIVNEFPMTRLCRVDFDQRIEMKFNNIISILVLGAGRERRPIMRLSLGVIAAFLILCGGGVFSAARADPYRWCAEYSAGWDSGGTNCGFVTLAQCQATVSGIGGFCRENLFYDGKPFNGRPAAKSTRKKRR